MSKCQHYTAKYMSIFNDVYSPEAIRAALISHWICLHPNAKKYLNKAETTNKFLQIENSSDVLHIGRHVSALLPTLELKDLEALFESLIDSSRKKKQGIVYTPNFIIDYLIKQAFTFSELSKDCIPSICDPACGCAGFLLRAADFLTKKLDVAPEAAFRDNIIGIDNDPYALDHASCLIELYLASKEVMFPTKDIPLFRLDSLLTPDDEIRQITGFSKGFTMVVTNPPYVKLQNLPESYRSRLLKHYKSFVSHNFSLAPLFIISGHKLLAPGGQLAVITQNNIFTSLAGRKIRQYFQDKQSIKRIIDFGHYKVFSHVNAYTCLLFLDTIKNSSIEYEYIDNNVTSERLKNAAFSNIDIGSQSASKWRLAKEPHLTNIRRIESRYTPLGKLVSIRVGFATLKDSVYFVKECGGECIAQTTNREKYIIEYDITRPAIKIAELNDESELKLNKRRLIYPYRKKGRTISLIPEDQLRSEYPKTYKYLLAHKPILEARDKGKKTYEAWYAWGRTQGRTAPGPKLLTKTFNRLPQFFLDNSDSLYCNGYGLFPNSPSFFEDNIPLHVLKLILGSKVMHYYVKQTSFQIDGNYQCYQKNFIERFGIPPLTKNQIQELTSYSPSDVDRLIADLYQIRLEDIEESL